MFPTGLRLMAILLSDRGEERDAEPEVFVYGSWDEMVRDLLRTRWERADAACAALTALEEQEVDCGCVEWPGERYVGAHHPWCRRGRQGAAEG